MELESFLHGAHPRTSACNQDVRKEFRLRPLARTGNGPLRGAQVPDIDV